MYPRLAVFLFFLILSWNGRAQLYFEPSSLQRLYDGLSQPVQNTILDSATVSTNRIVGIRTKADGLPLIFILENHALNHAGICLDGLALEDKDEMQIIRFLERALLRLSFGKTREDFLWAAGEMQMKILVDEKELPYSEVSGFHDLMPLILDARQFTLTKSGTVFFVEWKSTSSSLLLSFPNSYQLITGKNKKELDEEIAHELLGLLPERIISPSPDKEFESQTDTLPVILVRGSDYLNRISSDSYYKIVGRDSIPVFNRKSVAYSFCNLFQLPLLARNRRLSLTLALYGNRLPVTEISLQKLLLYFKGHFSTYCGLESESQGRIKGTVVWKHDYFDFLHLLYVDTPVSELFRDDGIIQAEFYPNIPAHNVTGLFSQSPETAEKPIINIKMK